MHGRRYATQLATSIPEANEFMENNRDYACLSDLGDGIIHMARSSDRGTPLAAGLPLVGVYRKEPHKPGFGTPLFRREDRQLVAQETSKGDRVWAFGPVDIAENLLQEIAPEDGWRTAGIGDAKLYAFQKADMSFVFGDRSAIGDAIRADLPNLRGHPFVWEEAADFCEDSEEFRMARATTSQFLERC